MWLEIDDSGVIRKVYIWLITIILWLKMANEKIEILKLLINNREESFSIRRISLLRKINYKSAYLSLKTLEKEGIVDLERIGNILVCKFNDKFNDLVFKAEYQRKKDLFKKKDFLVLSNRLEKINKQFILLLFGSYAKGTQTKYSDIDLLLISDKDTSKIVENELELIPLKTHLTTITYKGFVEMLKSKEPTVVTETIKNNLILFGIEDYYRIIQNAR
ncbi:MAG: nucleotidyltransferase domain-containing protein [Candidatus Pacearchaeota archaeon]|nr:nucleotidyltransferase domain-containing protein [Candidatus Pacearchaeota archaeon]